MGLVKPVWPVLQRDHPLAQGIVAGWPFYEGSGGTLNDLSGNPSSGALSAAGATWSGSPFGSALTFNGTTGQVAVTAKFATSSVWTISALFVCVDVTAGQPALFRFGTAALQLTNSPVTAFRFYDGASTVFDAGVPVSNAWTHYVVTCDGTNIRLYANGALLGTGTNTASLSASNVEIGSYIGSNFLNGSIAGTTIWSRALSTNEIAQLYFDPFAIYRPRSRWWESVITAAAAAPNWGYELDPKFPIRRRARALTLSDDATWPFTATAAPAQFGWDNPAQHPKRRRWFVEQQDDPPIPLQLGTLTPTQQGFAWEPQYPIRRPPRMFRDADEQYPRTVTATPTQFGWNVEPQFAERRKPRFNVAPSDEVWPRTATLTAGPLAWDSPIYRAIRRKFAPFVGDPDLLIATVTPTGQIVVSYAGPVWKRRRSRPPQ